ncbi:MAG: ATP-grasp domain-containing protein [Ruminococcaceae bacterium]|nr:ATP-grasp domain-containing protein [Oscillospiraceae bacterium]
MSFHCWLIYSIPEAKRNERNILFYCEESAKVGINLDVLYREYIKIGTNRGKLTIQYNGEERLLPDFVICRTLDSLLTRQLEMMGVPVFNNSFVAEITGDKARTYQYLSGKNIPMPATNFVRSWEEPPILAEEMFPIVAKPCCGRGGYAVELIKEQARLTTYAGERKAAAEDYVLQQPSGMPGRDLRVYVIGREPIAAMLRISSGQDIRANFCLGGEAKRYELSGEERALVDRITAQFDFGLVGVDFLFDSDGSMMLNEIEDVVGARMIYTYTDINLVGRYLEYITRRLKEK